MNQIVTPCLHDTSMNSPRYGSHCYEILCYNHVTNTEKQGGTGVNLYQNEKHTMNWCHANTPSD